MAEAHFRLAAYGVCRVDDRILLAHYVSPRGDRRHWTLPGGSVEHGEDPCETVVRELAEETGYQVEAQKLLGLGSRVHSADWGIPGGVELHRMAVFYVVRLTGGALRNEIDGSTDLATWFPIGEIPRLERSVDIDVALRLDRDRPSNGHVDPIPVSGRLRH